MTLFDGTMDVFDFLLVIIVIILVIFVFWQTVNFRNTKFISSTLKSAVRTEIIIAWIMVALLVFYLIFEAMGPEYEFAAYICLWGYLVLIFIYFFYGIYVVNLENSEEQKAVQACMNELRGKMILVVDSTTEKSLPSDATPSPSS